MEKCPCGSELTYESCCGMYISGQALPPTPEKLMRSRYTAYTQANMEYIANTMKSPAADRFEKESAKQWAASVEWLKLEIVESSHEDSVGFVEFLAYFREKNKRHPIHEISEFHLENGRWFYVDGKEPKKSPPIPNISQKRNDACLCGSGKKYKKCCGLTG